MQLQSQDIQFRPAAEEDAPQVLDLIFECETAEYGSPDASLEDLRYDWETTDLAQDSWLAFSPSGKLVGYALLMPWFTNLRYDFYVSPELESPDLRTELFKRCEKRCLEITASEPNHAGNIVSYIAHVNQRDRSLVEANGFNLVKHHFQMQIQMTDRMPTPTWPADIQVRNAIPAEDDETIHALIETAFARHGRIPSSFEDWQRAMMRADIFDPSLWFLAFEGERLVGGCLCYEYPGLGWVRQLGVLPGWRGKGLGSALLRQVFYSFQQRGFDKVGLSVDSENGKAYLFYQRLGMQRIRQYEQYEKTIPTP